MVIYLLKYIFSSFLGHFKPLNAIFWKMTMYFSMGVISDIKLVMALVIETWIIKDDRNEDLEFRKIFMKKFGHKSEYKKVQTKFSEALKNGVRSDTFVC